MENQVRRIEALISFMIFILVINLNAQIQLPSFISDNMVLQQKFEAPIWGWAELNCPPKRDPNVILGSKGEKIWEGLNLQLNKS